MGPFPRHFALVLLSFGRGAAAKSFFRACFLPGTAAFRSGTMFLQRRIARARAALREGNDDKGAKRAEETLRELESCVAAFERREPGSATDPERLRNRLETRNALSHVVEDWFQRRAAQTRRQSRRAAPSAPERRRRSRRARLARLVHLLLRLRAVRASNASLAQPLPDLLSAASLLQSAPERAGAAIAAAGRPETSADALSIAQRAERLHPIHKTAVVNYFTRGWRSLEGLRGVRAAWDAFTVAEGGSRIPGHWPSEQ